LDKLTSILAVVDRPEAGGAILDKSVALARRFGAPIDMIVGDPAHARALTSLCSRLGYRNVTIEIMNLVKRPLREIIVDRVRERQPDLVIKAPAGTHPMRRWTFDSNDWKLANESTVPLLLVRDTAWSEPPRFAAAVDIAGEENALIARGILQAAGFLALGCRADLDILYCERETREQQAYVGHSDKLAQLVREFHVGRERLQIFFGRPEKVLPPKVAALRYDVLVLGSRRGEEGFLGTLGGMTNRLVEATRGDVLLVRANCGADTLPLAGDASAREKRPHQAEQFL
jgi:nucleotide-binding universal stress UspA family protein